MHFMRSLYLDNIHTDSILNDSSGNYVTKRQILIEKENSRWLCFRGKMRIIYYPEFMRSYMVPMADCIEISKNGYFNPDLIRWQGAMVKKRVGDLLPYDYNLEKFTNVGLGKSDSQGPLHLLQL